MVPGTVRTADAEAGFDALLNLYNRHYVSDDYKSNLSSIRHNLRSSWDVDNDPFTTNQLGHPYQGSMYHGFARSAGLDSAVADPRFEGRLVDLDRSYRKLSPRQRAAVFLHYHHGYSIDECADLMSCGSGSVRTHLARAMASMRKEMAHA